LEGPCDRLYRIIGSSITKWAVKYTPILKSTFNPLFTEIFTKFI